MSDTSCDPTRAPAQTQVHLTVYAAPNRTRPLSTEHLSVDEILDAARSTVGERESLPYVAPHALREGGTRRGADIEIVSALLWLDFDGAWGPSIRSRLSGLWWRAFPSPSGRAGRARVLVLCSRPLSLPEARGALLYLDTLTGGKADRACLHAVQGYWLGRLPGVDWWEDGEDGTPLDVDALDLDAREERALPAPTSEDLAMWPAAWRADRATEIVGRWGDAEEGGRHAALFRVAQVCRDWAVPMDVTREIVIEWNEARCKPPREIEHIDRSILARVDQYRRHPVGCALPACVKLGHEHGPALDRVEKILAVSEDRLFDRHGELVIVDDEGIDRVVDDNRAKELISNRVYTIRWDEGTKKRSSGWKRCDAPPWVAAELLARENHHGLRPLEQIVRTPTLRPDGTVLTEPGYDAATGLYLCTDLRVAVPDAPTREQAADGVADVAAIFGQFPFASEAHRSVHMAYLLTAVALGYIAGPIPLVLFDANRRQTGKSKLATSIAIVAQGKRDPGSLRWYADEDKMERQVFSAASRSVLYYDNVRTGSVLESAVIDGMITSCSVAQTVLYTQEVQDRRARPIVVVTGNAIRIGGDLLPRALLCRLETTSDRPEQRDDLEIPDLIGHLADTRAAIVTALLTAWRAWLAAGAPRDAGLPRWATFSDRRGGAAWDDVRHLLAWLGWPDPCEVRGELQQRDAGEEALATVLEWARARDAFTATDLLRAAKPAPGFAGGKGDDAEERAGLVEALCHAAHCTLDRLDARSVGVALRAWADTPLDGWAIRKGKSRNKGTKGQSIVRPVWRAVPVGASTNPGAEG